MVCLELSHLFLYFWSRLSWVLPLVVNVLGHPERASHLLNLIWKACMLPLLKIFWLRVHSPYALLTSQVFLNTFSHKILYKSLNLFFDSSKTHLTFMPLTNKINMLYSYSLKMHLLFWTVLVLMYKVISSLPASLIKLACVRRLYVHIYVCKDYSFKDSLL